MSTISPPRTEAQDRPGRTRRLLLGLVLLWVLVLVAAAALRTVNGRDDTTTSRPPTPASSSSTSMPAGSTWLPAPTASSG